MTDQDWSNPGTASLGLFLAGRGIDDVDDEGNLIIDDDFFMILNGSDIDLAFSLPRASTDGQWQLLVDTADEPDRQEMEHIDPGKKTPVIARSMKLFIHYAKG
jgi:isoamylase